MCFKIMRFARCCVVVKLINLLVASGSQVFLTSLTLGVVDEIIHVSGLEERDLAMFHVKHGGVESINNEPEI